MELIIDVVEETGRVESYLTQHELLEGIERRLGTPFEIDLTFRDAQGHVQNVELSVGQADAFIEWVRHAL